MKVRVRAFGTLRSQLPDAGGEDGAEIEVPQGATVNELLGRLGLGTYRGAVVAAEGRILRGGDPLNDGSSLAIFQLMSGG